MNYTEGESVCVLTVLWFILNFSLWIGRTSEPNSPPNAGKHSCKRARRRRRRRQFIVSHQKPGLINSPMQFMAKCVYCCWHRNYIFHHTTSHTRFRLTLFVSLCLYFVGNVFYVGKLLDFVAWIRHAPFWCVCRKKLFLHIITFNMVYLWSIHFWLADSRSRVY